MDRLIALAGQPRVQGTAFLLACPAVLAGWTLAVEQRLPDWQPAETGLEFAPVPNRPPEEERTAWTDRGTPIPVYCTRLHETQPEDLLAEKYLVQTQGRHARLIRTSGPNRASNCHGWAFTGGRYLVLGEDVEKILTDNGYQVVTAPRVGDLVVYRTPYGQIAHSGVVRVADEELILVESKWSHHGRYLHLPDDYDPSFSWTCYRSSRAGHLLRGLENKSVVDGQQTSSSLGH
jgi:hypothetical protein